jgi:hypothetical protein
MTDQQVIIEVLMSVPDPNRRELVQTLDGLREADTELSEVFEDVLENSRFLWRTRCTDRATAERWMSSDHYRTLMAAIRVLGNLEDVRLCGAQGLE